MLVICVIAWSLQVSVRLRVIGAGNGLQSLGRQTNWATVNWATKQLGDNQLGGTFRSTGRHNFGYLWDSVGI